MDRVAIYCDENVHSAVARGLQRMGIDATTAVTEGKLGLSDEEQLHHAASAHRVLLTHNVQVFPRLHRDFRSQSQRHAGIIVARQDLSIGEIIRRVVHLSAMMSTDDMENRLEFLGSW